MKNEGLYIMYDKIEVLKNKNIEKHINKLQSISIVSCDAKVINRIYLKSIVTYDRSRSSGKSK